MIKTKKIKRILSKSKETLRGKTFNSDNLKTIKSMVKKYYSEGRTTISVEVCKLLNWKQPNGWLKDRACRDVLRQLEKKGYFELPKPKQIKSINVKRNIKSKYKVSDIIRTPLSSVEFTNIHLEQVKGSEKEEFWNWLVKKYHYLGFNIFVGRSLKYLIYSNDRIIGAIGFCDSAWSLDQRDSVLVSLGIEKTKVRDLGINNGRFLILPWVKVKNLASYLLSLSAKTVVIDWTKYYAISPLYIETFVNSKRFLGTCYKAANWIYFGKTKGYKKQGSAYHNSQTPKFIYIFPLKGLKRAEINRELEEIDVISKR